MHDTVIFERLHPDARVPERATSESAGYDLYVYLKGRSVRVRSEKGHEDVRECRPDEQATLTLNPGDVALMPLGFKARLPSGYEAQVRMRSSWAFKRNLTIPNAPGTIDADYPDEWMVMLRAGAPGETEIAHGDRIAQAVISRFGDVQWQEGTVAIVTDRVGGIGSTG